jgi:uncharacterized Tic20 family protein
VDLNPPEPTPAPVPPAPAAPQLPPAAPAAAYAPAAPAALTPSDERTLAMLAHLSNLLNPVTAFLGILVPLGMYLLYKDRSRYVAYQALQSFVFQLIWWVGAGAIAAMLWTVSGALAVVVVGCFLMPVALLVTLLPVASLIYSIYAGIECSQGRDFRYWLIGDWVRGTLNG